jgi:hypothetical protein
MLGIPPAIDTDAEDVVWALQTADALWKRNERVDAIVWLRRAAQSAGEAEDDDRAFDLARSAAELAEWMARNPTALAKSPSGTPDGGMTGAAVDDLLLEDGGEVDVDDLLVDSEPEPMPLIRRTSRPPAVSHGETARLPSISQTMPIPQRWPVARESPVPPEPLTPTPAPPMPRASPMPLASPVPAAQPATISSPVPSPSPMRRASPMPPTPTPTYVSSVPPATGHRASPMPPAPPARGASLAPRGAPPPSSSSRVLTAAEAHAGMLDPWADGEERTRDHEPPTAKPPEAKAIAFDVDEVVTSAPPVSHSVAELRAAPMRVVSPPPPPPSPPPRAEAARPASAPTATPAEAGAARPGATPESAGAAAPSVTNGVDLSRVEALSDLPDDARLAFAQAATVQTLAREDEVSGFALALVLDGSVDLSATIVDAAAQRLEAGAVLRARGTIASTAAVRLVGASDRSRVATWDDRAVTEAFRTCPWVEDELRAAGDRLQALVGITMGPLGERLDPALRADVASRLRLRILAGHEVLAARGTPVPAFLVVGAGELELLGDDDAPNGTVIRTGDFLFPNEALRAAPAPNTVRATKGGALILLAERGVAQELIMTCPPLLEIFAGM